MKNFIFKFMLLIAFTSFIGCADDDNSVPTNLNYPFKTTESYTNTGFVNNPITIQINLENDFTHASPGDLAFSFTYTSTRNGQINSNGVDYSEGDQIALHLGTNTVTYIPYEDGNHTITLNYKNNKDHTVTKTINITVTQPTFDFNLNGTSVTPYVGMEYPVGIYINNMNSPQSMTYQYSFTLLEGTASITREQNLLDPDNWYPVSHSVNHQIKIQPSSVGSLKILFKVKSQTGGVVEKTLTWNVQPGNFIFNLNNTVYNATFLNQEYPINLYVERGSNQPSDATFKFKYVLEEGNAQITKDGSLLEQNALYDIPNAQNTQIVIKPTTSGTLKIKFTAQDNYGSFINRTLLWSITAADFTFNASTNTQQILPTIPFNTTVMVDGTDYDPNMTFILKWGEVNSAGNWVGEVQTLPVNQAFYQSNVQFTFPEDGNYTNRTFRVEAKNNHNITKKRDFVINVKDPKPILNNFIVNWDGDDGGHPEYDFDICGINLTKSPLANNNNYSLLEVRVDGVIIKTVNYNGPCHQSYGLRLNINNGQSEVAIRVTDMDGRKTDWLTKAIPWP